ncbi:MAG: two-component regulator propeller domain-containing protein [Candidatus Cryptobacteroides sp.]
MKRIFCIIFTSLSSIWASAYYPIVHNYSKNEYKGAGKNWQISQSPYGNMYFANEAGILEFDGKEWSLTPTANRTSVRSLYYDEDGHRLYFGAINEFGYLDYNDSVKPSYTSLLNNLGTEANDIWGIHKIDDILYLRENNRIYKLCDGATQSINFNNKVSVSTVIDEDLYIFVNGYGVFVSHKEGSFNELKGAEALRDKNICAILKTGEDELEFVSATKGIYKFHNGKLSHPNTALSKELESAIAYCAVADEEFIAYGSVNNGVYILERKNGTQIHLNRSSGLQNNTVLSLYFDNQNNLWLGLDKGIDLVQLSSAEYTLLPSDSSIGSGYSSEFFNDRLFLGTNQGLYTLKGDTVEEVKEIKGQMWYLKQHDGQLFCCADRGLGIISADGTLRFIPLNGVWKILPLKSQKDYILACSYDKLFLLKKQNGRWEFYKWVEGFDESSKVFEEASDGSIWFSHWIKGLFRLRIDYEEGKVVSQQFLSKGNAFPYDWGNTPQPFDGDIIFSTAAGFYSFDEHSGKAQPIDSLNSLFCSNPTSASVYRCSNGDLFFSSADMQAIKRAGKDLDSLSLARLASKRIQGFEDFRELKDALILVNTEDGFSLINRTNIEKNSESYQNRLYIKEVSVAKSDRDSVIFYSKRPYDYPKLVVPYKDNSLKFKMALPVYGSQSNERFSFHLQGYDKGWSNYQASETKEYTKIPPGDYILQVKATIPTSSEILTDQIEITILKPFYKQWWAILIYIIVSAALLAGIGLYYKGRVEAKALALQKEKENQHKETMMQREIKMKADELASSTMDLVRKNEILQHIDEELQKAVDNIVEDRNKSLKIISRIRSNIKENISHDNSWKRFEQNFDQVYVDFLKRLEETFPQLTTTDKKICAYLKMGLSSKEIAPLLNITVRSVEMNRYRVRKKLGLGREENLTDYLDKF